MEGILPADVQWRVRKQDLSPNFRRGLRGRDRESVERLLADPLLAPYVDPGALRAARALLRAIFRAAMLSAWLRQREARSELPDEQQHAAAPVASP